MLIFAGAPSQPMVKESAVGDDNMSYKLVWAMESTVPIDTFKIRFRKVSIPSSYICICSYLFIFGKFETRFDTRNNFVAVGRRLGRS